MSGVIKLAEVLPQTKLQSLGEPSTSHLPEVVAPAHLLYLAVWTTTTVNYGKDMSGVIKLAEVLPQTVGPQVSYLRHTSQKCSAPLTLFTVCKTISSVSPPDHHGSRWKQRSAQALRI